jgi:hypothetical protein
VPVAEPLCDGRADGGYPTMSDARDLGQPAFMSRKLKGLKRIDVQGIMDSSRQLRPYPGEGLEELLGLERALQPLELASAPGGHDLHDRGADTAPYFRQLNQTW